MPHNGLRSHGAVASVPPAGNQGARRRPPACQAIAVPAIRAGRSGSRAYRAFQAPAHPARPWLAPCGPHCKVLRHDRGRGVAA